MKLVEWLYLALLVCVLVFFSIFVGMWNACDTIFDNPDHITFCVRESIGTLFLGENYEGVK